ncbi:hypothetical protein SCHPADRAFT_931558 [Schizopora paradoxa]|uniref:Uncharacterized protein n=1 Tax=Schizopora paradoxa TaxID=27342 RepID=A0A0H2RH34_9AGAM|nr:hypothetical protein SCHPADRAFT_931558 [Schizopora paradoxa]
MKRRSRNCLEFIFKMQRFASHLLRLSRVPLQEVQAISCKLAPLTAENLRLNQLDIDSAISAANEKKNESLYLPQTEMPQTPLLNDPTTGFSRRSSTTGLSPSKARKCNASGDFWPKTPPRGTFSSVTKSSTRQKLLLSPSPGTPPPTTPTLDQLGFNLNDIPTHSRHYKDEPRHEHLMTPEEWEGDTERRTLRRQIKKLLFATDVNCSLNELPLDINWRSSGSSMGLGLAPIDDEYQGHGRGRSLGLNNLEGFWPAYEAIEDADEDSNPPSPSTPNSLMNDTSELEARIGTMSVAPSAR